MDKIEKLTSLLKEIDNGESPEAVALRHGDFLLDINPIDIALAEERIFESEQDVDKLRQNCGKHVRMMGHTADRLREKLPASHVLRRMLAAHEMILCLMVDLEELNVAIAGVDEIHTTNGECRKLVHIVSHVSATREHFQLEEESVFPALSAAGLNGLVAAFKKDHAELAHCTEELLELMYNCCRMDFKQFKTQLNEISQWLVPFKREHIFKEDNLLYPMAYELIEEQAVWEHLGAKCDAVGYCCF